MLLVEAKFWNDTRHQEGIITTFTQRPVLILRPPPSKDGQIVLEDRSTPIPTLRETPKEHIAYIMSTSGSTRDTPTIVRVPYQVCLKEKPTNRI